MELKKLGQAALIAPLLLPIGGCGDSKVTQAKGNLETACRQGEGGDPTELRRIIHESKKILSGAGFTNVYCDGRNPVIK